MARPPFTQVLRTFALLGPLPAAFVFLVIAVAEKGFFGIAVWLFPLFFSYVLGLVPALFAGTLFTATAHWFVKGDRAPTLLAHCALGAATGFLAGCICGIVVFGTSPDLIDPLPLLERVTYNLLVLGLPGLLGGAIAGAQLGRQTRRSGGPGSAAVV